MAERSGKRPQGARKVSNSKKAKSVDVSDITSCGLCCEVVKDDEDESLILVRVDSGSTVSEEPFFCSAMHASSRPTGLKSLPLKTK